MPATFLVQKSNLSTTQQQTSAQQALVSDQVRLRIDRFALSCNNITYAEFGDAMNQHSDRLAMTG